MSEHLSLHAVGPLATGYLFLYIRRYIERGILLSEHLLSEHLSLHAVGPLKNASALLWLSFIYLLTVIALLTLRLTSTVTLSLGKTTAEQGNKKKTNTRRKMADVADHELPPLCPDSETDLIMPGEDDIKHMHRCVC